MKRDVTNNKNSRLSTIVKSTLLESVSNAINESRASEQAKSMGMQYVGFGRYTDGKVTYKSDGANLIPMDKSKEKGGSKEGFLEKFVKKCNAVAEETKSSKALLKTMLSLLPDKEKGDHYGKTEVLEKILNSAIPYFNKYVMVALKNEKFRGTLLTKYLEKFETTTDKTDILQQNPNINQPEKPTAVKKPNTSRLKPNI